MNYYEHHLGDYAKDTGHLSMIEHGAYRLLLDRYYGTEQGIPAEQAMRVARARTKEEKAAVEVVLAEFFTLADGVYVNSRAEEELEKANARIKAAQENGKRGGRPKKAIPGSVSETQEKAHQAPSTKHQVNPIADIPGSQSLGPTDSDSALLGEACRAMRDAGMPNLNQSNPDLAAALAEGVTPAELADCVREFPRKPMAYVLATARGRRRDVATIPPVTNARGSPGSRPPNLSEARGIAAGTRLSDLRDQPQRTSDERTIDAPADAVRCLG